MQANIDAAIKMYSGERPFELFVQKLDKNIEAMNATFLLIDKVFEEAGISNFLENPKDMAAQKEFAKLFQMLNKHLEAAQVQGFHWDQLEYWFDAEGQLLETPLYQEHTPRVNDASSAKLCFDETTYLVLAQRYKELFEGNGSGGEEVPFEIDSHLTAIDTGHIDTVYMESKFKKWLKSLDQQGVSPEEVERNLNELHAEFGKLSSVDQGYAQTLIQDIQAGDAELHPGWTLRDYINEYRRGTEEGNVARLVEATGVDEKLLNEMLRLHLTEGNLNAHGRFDELRASSDLDKARTFFASIAGHSLRDRYVFRLLDNLLRDFLIQGGFDVDEHARQQVADV